MTVELALKCRVLYYCGKLNTNPTALSDLGGIPRSTMKNIMSKKGCNSTLTTIKKICDVCEISLTEFFDCPEFNNLPQYIK